MIHLLDVNVLLALLDPRHVAHETAHAWFERTGRLAFATCPMTENGFARIASSRAYVENPLPIARLLDTLGGLKAETGHHFWAEDFSLLDEGLIDKELLTRPDQITDVYLLALAVRNRGGFATLDRRLRANAVHGGLKALVLITDQAR